MTATWARMAAAALIASGAVPAAAQVQFSAKVYLEGTTKPIRSKIEYKGATGAWREIGTTGADGALSASCPATGTIRANPHDLWEYTLSHAKDCRGQVALEVEKRTLSDARYRLEALGGAIDRESFARAYADAVLADLSVSGVEKSDTEALVAGYVADDQKLTGNQKERAATIVLNETSTHFSEADLDRNSLISAAELATALSAPD